MTSTTETPDPLGGGLPVSRPAPPSATITVTARDGRQVTVSTWTVCAGVGGLVERLLWQHGAPDSRVELDV